MYKERFVVTVDYKKVVSLDLVLVESKEPSAAVNEIIGFLAREAQHEQCRPAGVFAPSTLERARYLHVRSAGCGCVVE